MASNPQRSACRRLAGAEIKGVFHHARLAVTFLKDHIGFSSPDVCFICCFRRPLGCNSRWPQGGAPTTSFRFKMGESSFSRKQILKSPGPAENTRLIHKLMTDGSKVWLRGRFQRQLEESRAERASSRLNMASRLDLATGAGREERREDKRGDQGKAKAKQQGCKAMRTWG